MDHKNASEDQKSEHDCRLKSDPALKVHEERRIIPQESAAQPVHKVTADKFCCCR